MRLAHSIDSFVAQASMARRRGSLADEISSLLDMRHAEPGDDGDDALDGLGPGSLLAEDDVAPVAGARRLRQTGIDLGAAGAKYAGRVVSQKTRSARQRRVEEVEDEEEEEEEEGCDSDDDDDDDDEEEEEEDDDDDDDDNDEDDDEEDEEDGEDDEEDDDDQGEEGDDGDEEEEEEEEEEEDGGGGRAASGDDALYAEWSRMQAQESTLLSQLQESQADEHAEAKQVCRDRGLLMISASFTYDGGHFLLQLKAQHTAWLQLLHVRLKMQSALGSAAAWPSAEAQGSRLWGSTPELRSAAGKAAEGAAGLLGELAALRYALLPAAAAAAGGGSEDGEGRGSSRERRRTRGGGPEAADAEGPLAPRAIGSLGADAARWWAALEAADTQAWPWVEEQVGAIVAAAGAAGGAAGGAGRAAYPSGLKALRTDPLQQATHLLEQATAGSETRAQSCHRTNGVRQLGAPRLVAEAEPRGAAGGGGDVDGEGGGDGATGEVYDDADFYHALLRDLLDSDGGGGGGGGGGLGRSKLKRKSRPTDNRQSKGRKLSYEVKPKLLNFMFPEVAEQSVVLSELFGSIFGQRTKAATKG